MPTMTSLTRNASTPTDQLLAQDKKKRRSISPSALATILMIVAMVFGISTPVQAATTTYWNGDTIRNQIKSSSTTAMDGGSVESNAGTQLIYFTATVSGVGTFEGNPTSVMEYSHARTTTWVYCQWRSDFPTDVSITYGLICKFTH
jgi:hypothetical protein